ncbi:hypothetical protein EVAR_40374_1 [Eumeta japonica]|uniref:Uncharacterized protein n=1 Tax=Eumeta variegata TaxID=151549 RepID=A0A4C1XMM9_EUMVA|nr:hypothetical protein EVAR_40374_1 [Eumeta japonica]
MRTREKSENRFYTSINQSQQNYPANPQSTVSRRFGMRSSHRADLEGRGQISDVKKSWDVMPQQRGD